MMVMFFALLMLGSCTTAEVPPAENINAKFDAFLPQLNYFMTVNRLQEIQLPDFFHSETPIFSGVTLANLSTIVRKGNALAWVLEPGRKTIKVELGLKDARLHVNRCTFMRDGFTWTIGDSLVEVGMTVTNTPDGDFPCTATWDHFNVTRIDKVTVHTGDMEYDGKPPRDVEDAVRHYNKWLNSELMLEIAYKTLDVCKIWT